MMGNSQINFKGVMCMEEFKPVYGKFSKSERKFVCTKRHLLDDFLKEHAEFLHHYGIKQKYTDGCKYRMYVTPSGNKCTKHIKTQIDNIKKEVSVKDISVKEFDSVNTGYIVTKFRSAYKIHSNAEVILDIDTYKNGIYVIEIWSQNDACDITFPLPKGFYEVTGNPFFGNRYIACHTDNIITRGCYVIEGTDLIGKSTVVHKMIDNGYICMDRDQYWFSNYVDLTVPADAAATEIANHYMGKDGYHIAVFITSDETILKERLNARKQAKEHVSDYDELCCEYNRLYSEIAYKLRDYLNITIIDVYGKTPNQIIKEILGDRYFNNDWK